MGFCYRISDRLALQTQELLRDDRGGLDGVDSGIETQDATY